VPSSSTGSSTRSGTGSDGGFDAGETLQSLLDSALRQQAILHEQRASLEQQRADLHQQRQLLLRLLGERVTVVHAGDEHRDRLASAWMVDVRVAWVPTDDGGHGRLLVIRCNPPHTDAAQLASAHRASGERDDAAAGSLRAAEEALYDAVARQAVDPSWTSVEMSWVGEGSMSFAAASDVLAGPEGLHAKARELLVGDPMANLVRAADARFPLPTLVAPMMAEAQVAADVGTRSARTLLEATGLVITSADGTPVVVSACTRSLAHGAMVSMVEDPAHVSSEAVPAPRGPDDAELRRLAIRRREAAPESLEKRRAAGQRRATARAARLAGASSRADAVLEAAFGTGDPVLPDPASDGAG
jgi:hypothetical protein